MLFTYFLGINNGKVDKKINYHDLFLCNLRFNDTNFFSFTVVDLYVLKHLYNYQKLKENILN